MLDPHGFAALLAAYLEWLRARNYSEDTARSRRRLLGYLIDWLEPRGLTRPQEVTRPVLERYQRWMFQHRRPDGRPLSFSTQQRRLVAAEMFFQWLAKRNFILSNPASDLELPRRENRLPKAVLSAAEVERLMATVDLSTPGGLRNRTILETFYATGIRGKELIGLRLFDLDFERRTAFIRQGKGKKDRLVPIGTRALGWLNRYLAEVRPELARSPDEGEVFLSDLGEAYKPGAMTELVRCIVRRSGLAKAGACHLFRHTVATLMLENGADIRFIQELLGHAHLNTTEVYTRVSIRKLQEIYTATHPAGRAGASPAAASADARRELDQVLAQDAREEPEA